MTVVDFVTFLSNLNGMRYLVLANELEFTDRPRHYLVLQLEERCEN